MAGFAPIALCSGSTSTRSAKAAVCTRMNRRINFTRCRSKGGKPASGALLASARKPDTRTSDKDFGLAKSISARICVSVKSYWLRNFYARYSRAEPYIRLIGRLCLKRKLSRSFSLRAIRIGRRTNPTALSVPVRSSRSHNPHMCIRAGGRCADKAIGREITTVARTGRVAKREHAPQDSGSSGR
jgi:hypothetical protein